MRVETTEGMICSRAIALRRGAAMLAAAGIEQPEREARRLLAYRLGISREALLADPSAPVDMPAFEALVARRAAHEPLAYITGEREFWSLPFAVSDATLIPRPDSETLIEAALVEATRVGAALVEAAPVEPGERSQVRRVLDLGTGTGCLLLAALTEFPQAFGVGVDCCPRAAALAARNAGRLGLARRAGFLVGDWADALTGRFDLILCNPPYVASAEISALMPEVARHEPASALDGGEDGLHAYRRLIPGLHRLLAPAGAAVLELGAGMAAEVGAIACRHGLEWGCRADLAGIPRAMVLRVAGALGGALAGPVQKTVGSCGPDG